MTPARIQTLVLPRVRQTSTIVEAVPRDDELKVWARRHLVYEVRMLVASAVELSKHDTASPQSNALLESFLIHARCLRDFLWGTRSKWHSKDAFAQDFCEPAGWERERGEVPPALAEIGSRERMGRELAHLTYHRKDVSPDAKLWACGDVCLEIIEALDRFMSLARPEVLDADTHQALMYPQSHFPGVGPPSVGLGTYYESDLVQGLEMGS
jgi:hypothetical protein